MNKLIFLLIYLLSILFIISSSQVTAQTLPPIRGTSMISNFNFTSAPFTTGSSNDSNNCDYSSYPDFCILPPPPNLNCDDVYGEDFTVLQSDPHGFDRDNDGEGCETSE